MKSFSFAAIGLLALVLGVACGGSSSLPGLGGTGGTGGTPGDTGGAGGSGGGPVGTGGIGGADCKRLEYASAGCNVAPICTNGSGGACGGRLACGCDGKIISGCGLYSEAYAYLLPVSASSDGDAGTTCDPNAQPGIGGSGGGGGSAGGGGGGAAGAGGFGDAGCKTMYTSPGCSASPTCLYQEYLCVQRACGCDGQILYGCGAFSEPYAYFLGGPDDNPTTTCDPNAGMGGAGGH